MPTKAQLVAQNKGLRADLAQAQKRLDGWANLFTGMGIQNRDPKASTYFKNNKALTERDLSDIYRFEGMGRNVIDIPANEAIREGFTVSNDSNNLIVESLKDIDFFQFADEQLRWDRLTGGGVMLMYISDGSDDLEQPLNEDNMQLLEGFKIYDRFAVTWNSADLYRDSNNSKFGTPEYYQISPRSGGLAMFRVHESRLVVLDGVSIPELNRAENNGWGDSVIDNCFTQLRSLGNVLGATETIMDDFIQAVLSIENLQNLIAGGQEQLVQKRLELLDLSKHMINTMMIDNKESYTKTASTVTGIPDVIDRFMTMLSSVTCIPVPVLFGQSPKGLGSEGADSTSLRRFYDMVDRIREFKFRKVCERVTSITQRCKQGPTNGSEIEGWAIEFPPLWQPTQKEIIETRKLQAEIDEIHVNIGVLEPEEVTESRYGGESYSYETTLIDGARNGATSGEDS